jgi:hypothetical protein
LFLRALRAVTLAVDDWIQRQEVILREGPARARYQAEVDPIASAVREKAAQERNRKALLSQGYFDEQDVLLPREARSGEKTASASPKNLLWPASEHAGSTGPETARGTVGQTVPHVVRTQREDAPHQHARRPRKGVVLIRKPKPARLRYRAGQFVREA